jgi:hypothetical protein
MGLVNLSRRASTHLPDGAVDVRGWKVFTELDGEKVGTIDDLLVDDFDNPRFYDVDLGIFKKHVLLPVSEAHPDPSQQVVWVDRMDKERLREVPRYDRHPEMLSEEYEDRLRTEYRLLTGDGDGNATVSTEPRPRRLARLGDLDDFRVAKGVIDPRGWKVVSGDGQPIGEVSELIVEPIALTTRYLDCWVDEKKLELEPLDRHILLPVERVRLDRRSRHVVVDGLFTRDLGEYPVYGGLPLEPFDLERLRGAFKGSAAEQQSTTLHDLRDVERVDDADDDLVDRERTILAEDDDLRIRIRGDDIIIQRRPRGSHDDG